MKTSFHFALSLSLLTLSGAALLSSCSGSSSSADAGDAAATGDANTTGDTASDGPVLFGLSKGDSCFDIVSAEPNPMDGCNLGVADTVANMGAVGATKLVHYDIPTATITVGTAGSLGTGVVTNNMGTLLRDGDTSDSAMTSCTWHQKDTSTLTMTATNEFKLAVTEVETMFAAVPACTSVPTGGMCTSTWTWTMRKNPNKSPTTTPPCM